MTSNPDQVQRFLNARKLRAENLSRRGELGRCIMCGAACIKRIRCGPCTDRETVDRGIMDILGYWAERDDYRPVGEHRSERLLSSVPQELAESEWEIVLSPEKPPFVIVIDSREQSPYSFGPVASVIKGLKSGDYSVEGFESDVAIERKSCIDAYGSIGNGRARFEAELIRLAAMEYAALVIECSLVSFLVAPEYSSLNPKSAIGSLLAWSVKYRLPVFFCGDRPHAQATTLKLLEKFYKYKMSGELLRPTDRYKDAYDGNND